MSRKTQPRWLFSPAFSTINAGTVSDVSSSLAMTMPLLSSGTTKTLAGLLTSSLPGFDHGSHIETLKGVRRHRFHGRRHWSPVPFGNFFGHMPMFFPNAGFYPGRLYCG